MSETVQQTSDVFYHLIKLDETDNKLANEIKEHCGVDIEKCLECGKCTGGCSNTHIFDVTPRKIVQLIKLGQEDKLLKMDSLWTCVSCQLCSDRCPSEISVAKIMDYLREKNYRRKIKPTRENVMLFHNLVLDSVRHSGRMHEIGSVMKFNMGSGMLFKDTELGIKMFLKGQLTPLSLLHFKIKNVKQIRRIFNFFNAGGEK